MREYKTGAPEPVHAMLPACVRLNLAACPLRPHAVLARTPHPRLHTPRAFTGSDIALLFIWGLYMLQLVHAALEEF